MIESSPYGVIGSGRQKDVRSTDDPTILEKRNRHNSETEQEAAASHCLLQILCALLPNNFAKEYDYTLETHPTEQMIISRRVERIRAGIIEKCIGLFLKEQLIIDLQQQLEAMGFLAVLDPVERNFIFKYINGKATVVYIDTVKGFGYKPRTTEQHFAPGEISSRTVDEVEVRRSIEAAAIEEQTKTQLLSFLDKYTKLSAGLELTQPDSFWSNIRD